jgi:xanthine dehydrogenase YagS FAD-binding subunit
MHDFAYARATQLRDAVARLGTADTVLIAGGTELLNWMRLGIAEPKSVVDIGRIGGLDQITVDGDGRLAIGALATLNAVGEHALVVRHAAALAQACLKAASAQVRNRATLGGNVLQKTRCAYFRAEAPLPWPCNKRMPGSGCAARDGLNERHAIFGWTDACVAVQPSDPAVALACLDADVEIEGPRGGRSVPMSSFHLTQQEAAAEGQDPATYETRLAHDELIVGYRVPQLQGLRSAYVKVRERESYEYALVSAAAALQLDGTRIRSARVALGSVAQRPWRLAAAEASLAGCELTREALLPALDESLRDAQPLAHNRYKVTMARHAALRALLTAGGAA